MNINIQSLKDFQVCERYFDYRYNDGIPPPQTETELMKERFDRTLKRVVSFFFYRKQGGATPSLNSLLNRWEKLWFPKDVTAYELSTIRNLHQVKGSLVSYSTLATAALLKFHEDFSDDNGYQPLLIDESFLIPLTKDMRLQGMFDLVLRDRNNQTVIKWYTSPYRQHVERYQFDFAALKLAYEYRNMDRDLNIEYGFYDLTSANPGFTIYKIAQEDIDSLLLWANKLYQTSVYVPRRGFTIYCKHCPYDAQCKDWKPEPHE